MESRETQVLLLGIKDEMAPVSMSARLSENIQKRPRNGHIRKSFGIP